MTEVEGFFFLEKQKSAYCSALIADLRIFADQITITQLFDPYSIRYLIRAEPYPQSV